MITPRTLLVFLSLLPMIPSVHSYQTTTTVVDFYNGLVYSQYKDRNNYVLEYDGIEGLWHGVYNCPQGDTNLILQVGTENYEGYSPAVFIFFPTDYNPSVKSGSFKMRVKHHRDGSFVFKPTAWIIRPFGYETVGLTVHETTSRHREIIKMSGTVDTQGCSLFFLNRL